MAKKGVVKKDKVVAIRIKIPISLIKNNNITIVPIVKKEIHHQ